MRKLTNEQPPKILGNAVNEWLSRLIININACLDQVHDMDGIDEMPKNPTEGMIRYFKQPVPPEITSKGFWGYDGTWSKL